jgi:hypothetical protein
MSIRTVTWDQAKKEALGHLLKIPGKSMKSSDLQAQMGDVVVAVDKTVASKILEELAAGHLCHRIEGPYPKPVTALVVDTYGSHTPRYVENFGYDPEFPSIR